MTEMVWKWDTKRDRIQAEEMEHFIKKNHLDKTIRTIEKYVHDNEIFKLSVLINEIKLVIKNDE